MSIVGVFARANHPEGWGYPVGCGECGAPRRNGRAHGYVVLFVRCADDAELEAVVVRLRRYFAGPPGMPYLAGGLDQINYQWFGGEFELLATAPDVAVPGGPFSCRGDNRMIAVYDASDVLAA